MLGESRRLRRWATIGAASLALQFVGAPSRAAGPAAPSAEELADQAFKLQQAGEYAEAIGTYVRAYNLSPVGAILFNIATLYDRKLHERALAMEYFRRYLQAPDAEASFIQKATERLSVLKAEVDAEERARRALPTATAPTAAPAPAPPAPTPPPVSPPVTHDASLEETSSGGSGLHAAGLVVGITGIAGVGASMVLGLLAKNKNDEADKYCGPTTCHDQRGVTLEQQTNTLGVAGTATFVAGAALVATGVTMYLLAPSRRAPSAAIAIGPVAHSSAPGVKLDVTF
jgi:hypothetical protein